MINLRIQLTDDEYSELEELALAQTDGDVLAMAHRLIKMGTQPEALEIAETMLHADEQ
jgi:hypothetical protein